MSLPKADQAAKKQAIKRQSQLTKPPGSLGKLEEIAAWLAAWQGDPKPQLGKVDCLVFAGNHGVAAKGVSAFPAEVTAQMVANFESGGAAINQLCKVGGANLKVIPLKLEQPTKDFTTQPAMTEAEALEAFNIGAAAVDPEADLVLLGEMGIANSTAAAALAMACFDGRPIDWIGPGTGLKVDEMFVKASVVQQGVALHADRCECVISTLAAVGGRELAAIAGAVLSARLQRIPVVLDGYICTAAAAVLQHFSLGALDHCLVGHCSAEPGHKRILAAINKSAIVDLDMRLGEASGAAVALLILRAAIETHNGMASFEEAGVSSGDE